MQIICEAYQLMKKGLGLSPDEMHRIFDSWNKTELDSYLIEITADILGLKTMTDCHLSKKFLTKPDKKARGNGSASIRWIWAFR